jgi:hypothetical protein
MRLLELLFGSLGGGLAVDVLRTLCPRDRQPVAVFRDIATVLVGQVNPLVELLDVGADRVQNGHVDSIGLQGFVALGGDFNEPLLEARCNALNCAVDGSDFRFMGLPQLDQFIRIGLFQIAQFGSVPLFRVRKGCSGG